MGSADYADSRRLKSGLKHIYIKLEAESSEGSADYTEDF